jgi:hypothetical protein
MNTSTLASQASFSEESSGKGSFELTWGDVLKGIEDMSHNVTAGLLSAEMQLGNTSAECFFDQPSVVYQYNSLALWAPYGVSIYSPYSSECVLIFIYTDRAGCHLAFAYRGHRYNDEI